MIKPGTLVVKASNLKTVMTDFLRYFLETQTHTTFLFFYVSICVNVLSINNVSLHDILQWLNSEPHYILF